MNYVFANPDKVMVGVRGEVGSRLFLLQAREGSTTRDRSSARSNNWPRWLNGSRK